MYKLLIHSADDVFEVVGFVPSIGPRRLTDEALKLLASGDGLTVKILAGSSIRAFAPCDLKRTCTSRAHLGHSKNAVYLLRLLTLLLSLAGPNTEGPCRFVPVPELDRDVQSGNGIVSLSSSLLPCSSSPPIAVLCFLYYLGSIRFGKRLRICSYFCIQ
jgi:hypothetical protein